MFPPFVWRMPRAGILAPVSRFPGVVARWKRKHATRARSRPLRRGYTGNKTVVVAAMQRGGTIRLQVVRGRDSETMRGFIREDIGGDVEAIDTDEWPAYRGG